MRRIVLFALVAWSVPLLHGAIVKRPAFEPRFSGAEIGEWTMDLDSALTQARNGANNVVVLFTGAWWCPHCQALEEKVLTQPAWHDYAISNRLYLVMMDFPGRADQYWCWLRETNYVQRAGLTLEQGEAEIVKRYGIQTAFSVPGSASNTVNGVTYARVGYPTMIVLRSDGSSLGRFTPLVSNVSMDMVLRNVNQLLAADAADEADNYYQAATYLETPICDDRETLAAENTLSESDVADWFAFDATAGVQWSFLCRETGLASTEMKVQVFSNPTNPVSVAERTMVPSDSAVVSYVVPQSGRYWLKVSRSAALTNVVGYALSYWYGTPPASVSFYQPTVSVSEGSQAANLTVNIRDAAADAEIRVGYETLAGSALPGHDYVESSGVLVWPAGVKLPKKILVPLLPDQVWEGDETFVVRLFAIKNCAIGEQLAVCTVTLKETTSRQPGKLGFEAPDTCLLTEGSNVLFSVVRSRASDGVVTARVEHIQGTSRRPVAELVWKDREIGSKDFGFTFTNEPGFQTDRSSVLRLTPLGGASLVSSAGGTIKVTRRDDWVVQTLDEYLSDPQHATLGLKATQGRWFYGLCSEAERPEAWLRCEPMGTGSLGASTLTATVNGPGVLMFDWRLSGQNATFNFSLGNIVQEALAEKGARVGVLVSVPLTAPKPAWTVWRRTGGTDVFGAVRNLVWFALPQASKPLPLDKAAVINRDFAFSWQDVLAATAWPSGANVQYELHAGISSARLTKLAELDDPEFPRTGNEADQALLATLIGEAKTSPIYWRVDTVVKDPAGRKAVFNGSLWTVTVLPDGSAEFVSSDGGYSPGADGSVNLPELTIGVMSEIGPFAVAARDGGAVQVAVRNGSLPEGMKAAIRDGNVWIVGAPTRIGSGAADLHLSTRRLVGSRMITVPGSCLKVIWSVKSLGRAAGQFNGYRVVNDRQGDGYATLTVTENGRISGKILREGIAYMFSEPAFGGCSNTAFVVNTFARAGTNRLALAIQVAESGTGAVVSPVEGNGEDGYSLWRNNWKDADMIAALGRVAGYYTVALPVTVTSSKNTPQGTGYLSLNVSKGVVTYAGQTGAGKNVSGSSPLLFVPDCCSAEDHVMFYVYAVPSGGGAAERIYGLIDILSGDDAMPSDNTLESLEQQGLCWFNTVSTSVYGSNPWTGEASAGIPGFSNTLAVVGGFYDKMINLESFYSGLQLGVASSFKAPANYDGVDGGSPYTLLALPDRMRLPVAVVSPSAVSFPPTLLIKSGGLVDLEQSTNPWMFSVKIASSSGIFSGSFKCYYQGQNSLGRTAQVTKTFMVKGVFVPRRNTPEAYYDWMGSYQIPDKCLYEGAQGRQLSYSFNWSFPFAMGAAAFSE